MYTDTEFIRLCYSVLFIASAILYLSEKLNKRSAYFHHQKKYFESGIYMGIIAFILALIIFLIPGFDDIHGLMLIDKALILLAVLISIVMQKKILAK